VFKPSAKGKAIKLALQEVKDDLTKQGFEVAYICVYGSQNYGLDIHTSEYMSDIDMKAVIIPTLEQMVNNNKPISKTQDTKYGQVDIKDIRPFIDNLKKANPSYIECLFTKHYLLSSNYEIADHVLAILNSGEDLCKAQSVQMMKAMYGMIKEKQKALCHPYPSIKDKIDKFGYCGKQLSHAYRLLLMMKKWSDGEFMEDCLIPTEEYSELMDMKLNKFTLEKAIKVMELTVKSAKTLLDEYLKSLDGTFADTKVLEDINTIKTCIIKDSIKQSISNEVLNDVIKEVQSMKRG